MVPCGRWRRLIWPARAPVSRARSALTAGGWTPAATAIGLVFFFGYLTFRAFNATYVWYDPYISPTVAPPLFTPASGYPGAVPVDHAWFGAFPAWWPSFLPQSPAFFLPGLAIAFRFTCYYYRGAYYKAFVHDAAVLLRARASRAATAAKRRCWCFRTCTATRCTAPCCCSSASGGKPSPRFFATAEFGIGVGTVVMLINAALLSGYTFGCHSWRHLIGGRLDCFTCDGAPSAATALERSSWLNERHMAFAWFSLVWVAFTDLYIYLVSTGTIRDLNTW